MPAIYASEVDAVMAKITKSPLGHRARHKLTLALGRRVFEQKYTKDRLAAVDDQKLREVGAGRVVVKKVMTWLKSPEMVEFLGARVA
jgi:hypothetical protein